MGDEVGFSGLVLPESCGHGAEPFADIGGVDLDGRVGLDLFVDGGITRKV